MSYYDTPWPVAYPWERHVPVPGWGFTPNLAGPSRVGVGDDCPYATSGLGLDVPIHFPVIGTQHFQIPIEDMAKHAVDAAWPDIQAKIQTEYKQIIADAIARVEAEIPVIINKNTGSLSTDIWKALQPKLEVEIDKVSGTAKTGVGLFAVISLATTILAAMWVKAK